MIRRENSPFSPVGEKVAEGRMRGSGSLSACDVPPLSNSLPHRQRCEAFRAASWHGHLSCVALAFVVCGTGFASAVIYGVQPSYCASLSCDAVAWCHGRRFNGPRSLAKPVAHLPPSVEKCFTVLPNAAVPQPNRERARIWYAPRPTCGRCQSLIKHARTVRACHTARL